MEGGVLCQGEDHVVVDGGGALLLEAKLGWKGDWEGKVPGGSMDYERCVQGMRGMHAMQSSQG